MIFFFFCLLCKFFIGCQTLWILPYLLLGIFILLSLFLSCVLAYNLVTWEQCDPFEAFVVFLDKARAVLNLWLIFPIIDTVPLWVLFWYPIYYKAFPLWLVEIRTLPGSVSAPRLVLLLPVVLSLALGGFFTWMHWLVLSWRLENNHPRTRDFTAPFSVTLSCLVFSPTISGFLGFLEFSTLCLQPGRPLGSSSVSPPCIVAWELCTGSKQREAMVGFTICFLSAIIVLCCLLFSIWKLLFDLCCLILLLFKEL